MRTHIIASLIICVYLSSSESKVIPWDPIDWTYVTPALPTDAIDVYYLLAPLLEDDIGTWGETFNVYHGAIGFNNSRTGDEYTLNYDAFDFFRNSLFPIINTNGTNGTQLTWVDGGATYIYTGINESYWIADQVRVAQINGSVFNQFIKWSPAINETYPYYDMFALTDPNTTDIYLNSFDCFDFVWLSFEYLYAQKVKFDYTVNVSRNYMTFWGESPVDMSELYNTSDYYRTDINDFYIFTELKISDMSVSAWASMTYDVTTEGLFYIHQDSKYWMTYLEDPLMTIKFLDTPLPGAPAIYI